MARRRGLSAGGRSGAAAASGSALCRELGRLVGAEHVLAGRDATPYETDATSSRGLRGAPDAVVLPADAEQVAAVMAWCCERGVPLVPRGGGTGLAGGAVPVFGGVVLALERLAAIEELVPEQWRLRVGAGVSTATVKRLARENGLLFAPDPGASEQSQIGGNVATNAGGPHAFKYGATGAWVTGLRAVLAPGRLTSLGGDLRRDVGGYDVKSLLVGSEGTLGVITEVTLRLLPAPETVIPLVAFFASVEHGGDAVGQILGAGLTPAALDYVDEPALEIVAPAYPGTVPAGSRFALIAEVDGPGEEARRQAAELRDVLETDALQVDDPRSAELWRWREGFNPSVTSLRGGKVGEDIVVPVSRLAEAVQRIRAVGEELAIPTCTWGHAGDGNIHANFVIDPADPRELDRANENTQRFFDLAVELGGRVTGEHGIGYLKRGQLARQWSEPEILLHERVKHAFDPTGVLNPGKKLARLTAAAGVP